MNMNIRHNGESAFLTEYPELIEIATVEADDAGIETMRIEIIVKNEIGNPGPVSPARSQHEGSALTGFVSTTLPKPREKSFPQSGRYGEPMPRRDEAAHSRRN